MMDIKKPQTASSNQPPASNFQNRSTGSSMRESSLNDAASTLLNDSKRVASELYEEGKNRVSEAQNNIKEYSDQIARRVNEKPLMSLLIAGGIGFLLSAIFRR
jgi:ElaB/YqjD/DUF883 family membrane-anchored ribosome-binding protein